MAITAQVQRAILQMKAAGFARSEFSATVEGDGRRGYGDATIYVKDTAASKAVADRIPEICATGLGVITIVIDYQGERRAGHTITARYDMRGVNTVLDCTAADENGRPARSETRYQFDAERFESSIRYY